MVARFNEDNKKYECTIGNLSDKAAEALKELGIQIKEKDTMGKYIVGKSLYVFEPRQREDKPEKGWFITAKSNYEIKPIDNSGNDITDPVGNGSRAIALIKPYEWSWKNKKGVSPSLVKIIITDLKVYNPDSVVEEEDEIPL